MLAVLHAVPGRTWLALAAAAVGRRGAARRRPTPGANLGWNLGHNDFASVGRAQHYMGVHVTLTGVRGAHRARPLGMLIYQWLESLAAGRRALFAGAAAGADDRRRAGLFAHAARDARALVDRNDINHGT